MPLPRIKKKKKAESIEGVCRLQNIVSSSAFVDSQLAASQAGHQREQPHTPVGRGWPSLRLATGMNGGSAFLRLRES